MAKKKEKEDNKNISSEEVDIVRNKDKEEKLRIFDAAMAKSGVECRSINDKNVEKVDVISTGVLSVDRALKVFGFPRGRIIELYGEEGSGKSMLSFLAAGQVQRKGGIVVLVDMECAYDHNFGRLLGVTDDIRIATPESAEKAFDYLVDVIETGTVDLIILDSVANMVPQAELDGEMGDAHIALLAKIMARGLRKVTNAIARTKTCLIFINQIRMKIGVMFGDPRTTTGGNALKFYASIRAEVSKPSGGAIKDKNGNVVGHHSHVVIRKNKVGPPFGEGDMYVYYNWGIDIVKDICTVAKEEGIIEGTTWLSYKSEIYKSDEGIIRMQGFDNFVEFMRNKQSVVFEMREKVVAKIEKEREEFQNNRNLLLEEISEKVEVNIDKNDINNNKVELI